MTACPAFRAQLMQDPVRLIVPVGVINISEPNGEAGLDNATITIQLSNGTVGGVLRSLTNPTGTLVDYNAVNGSWWGRIGGYNAPGALGIQFPGHFYEAQLSLVSGALSGPPLGFGTFVRLGGTPTFDGTFTKIGVGTDTATVRLSFRRFGTTTVLITKDFNLSLTNI